MDSVMFSCKIQDNTTPDEILSTISTLRSEYRSHWGKYPEIVILSHDMCNKLSAFCTQSIVNFNSTPPCSRVHGIKIEVRETDCIVMCLESDYLKYA